MSGVTHLDAGSTDRSHGCCWIGLTFALKLLTFLHCWSPKTFSRQLRSCHDPTCSTQETADLRKVSKGALWGEEGWRIQGCLGSASLKNNSNIVHTGLNIWPSLWKYQHQQCHHHTMLLIAIIITIIVKDIFLLRSTLFPCSSADTQRTIYWSIMQIRCWSVSIVLVMCRRDGVHPPNTCADEKPDQSTSRRLSVCATLDRVRSFAHYFRRYEFLFPCMNR